MLEKLINPLLSFKYHVVIGEVVVGCFTECGGLSAEREVEVVKEGGVNGYEYKLPGRIKYGNISLKRGVTLSGELWNWFHKNSEDTKKFFQVERRFVEIIEHNLFGFPVRMWSLEDAYPVKWKGSDRKSDGSEVAVEILELTFNRLYSFDISSPLKKGITI